LLALGGLVALASYGWWVYARWQRERRLVPQVQLTKLIPALQRYHAGQHTYPPDFRELNQRIWHTQPAPDYGPQGRQARTQHYYYVYTRVQSHTCVLWALPTGPRRELGAAYLLVLTPTWARQWQGQALDEAVFPTLPVVPRPDQLEALGLQELPPRRFDAPARAW